MFHSSLCQVQTDPVWHGGKHTLLSDVSKLVLTFRPLAGFLLGFLLLVCLLAFVAVKCAVWIFLKLF